MQNFFSDLFSMLPLREVLSESKTVFLQSFRRKSVHGGKLGRVVSITFDDVPISVLENGIPCLDRINAKATLYACLGLEGGLQATHLNKSQLELISEKGHEVACHTYSHYKLSTGTVDGLVKDAEINRKALFKLKSVEGPLNFSYPFGDINLAAKSALSRNYMSLRSTRKGINKGWVDLNCLKAVPVYEGAQLITNVSEWLDKLDKGGGWLIFYTHGVSCAPSKFDVHVDSFDTILGMCKYRNIPILPVRTVINDFLG